MRFIVTALTADLCQEVAIRPASSRYAPIYSCIFGPAEHQNCVEFQAEHKAQCLKGDAVASWLRGEDPAEASPAAAHDGAFIAAMASETALRHLPDGDAFAEGMLVRRIFSAHFTTPPETPSTIAVHADVELPAAGLSAGAIRAFRQAIPPDGVITAGVFAQPSGDDSLSETTSPLVDGTLPFDPRAVRAIHLVGSQGSLLCLPGPDGPFSRQVDGSRLIRGTGQLVQGQESFLIHTTHETFAIGARLPEDCCLGQRVRFAGVRLDVSFCREGTGLYLLATAAAEASNISSGHPLGVAVRFLRAAAKA